MRLTVAASLLFVANEVLGNCPSIYRMLDSEHSYCAKKVSVQSLVPASKEIESIVAMHNEERSNVQSKDMQKMYWNTDLANIAQRYADHCRFDHDKSIQRQAPRIPLSTGQNLAMGYKDWQSAIQGWADEKTDFVYGSTHQNGMVGHYTQMVKDTAVLIGCGLAICPKSHYDPNRDWPNYVCTFGQVCDSMPRFVRFLQSYGHLHIFANTAVCPTLFSCLDYVTGQLGDNKPYALGDPSTPTHERLADCGGLVCLYGGTIDLKGCQCHCPSHASGKGCERLDCSSLPSNCKYGTDKSICTKYANVPTECPKFCGLCELYDEAEKYYQSNTNLTNDPDQASKTILSTFFSKETSRCFVFTQCIIVTWIHRFRKE